MGAYADSLCRVASTTDEKMARREAEQRRFALWLRCAHDQFTAKELRPAYERMQAEWRALPVHGE